VLAPQSWRARRLAHSTRTAQYASGPVARSCAEAPQDCPSRCTDSISGIVFAHECGGRRATEARIYRWARTHRGAAGRRVCDAGQFPELSEPLSASRGPPGKLFECRIAVGANHGSPLSPPGRPALCGRGLAPRWSWRTRLRVRLGDLVAIRKICGARSRQPWQSRARREKNLGRPSRRQPQRHGGRRVRRDGLPWHATVR